MNTFKPHSTQKVKLYFVDWVEFYILGGILPRDHLVTWLCGDPVLPIIGFHPMIPIVKEMHKAVNSSIDQIKKGLASVAFPHGFCELQIQYSLYTILCYYKLTKDYITFLKEIMC